MNSMQSLSNQFTRRRFLGGAAAAAGLSLASHGCGGNAGRPNVLWMIAEDFSPDLGCYGNKLVQTPNIDRLAGQGVRYTNAIMTAPVCSAARSALAVGMYQTSVGGHNHRSHRNDGYQLPDPVRPFTHYLQEAGYHTSNLRNKHGLQGTGKTDFNYNVEHVFDGEDWSERQPGQPFYAQINFHETHRAFSRFADHPVDPAQVELPPYYPDHPAVRLDWALYLDAAQNLDVKIGRVLQRLEEEGLAEDTIVFFFGDHGRPMPRGKQFLYEGGILIPLIVRMPEKYRLDGFTPGTVDDKLVSSIAITASTLKLAGIEPPSHMEGRMFLGAGAEERDYVFSARDRCDETVDRIRSVRDKRFKYIRNFYPDRPYTQQNVYKDHSYPSLRVMRDLKAAGKLEGPPALFLADTRPPEEFYDLESDPYEIRNLIGEPAHQAKIAEMRTRLDEWIKETGDMGQTPEENVEAENPTRAVIDGWCSQDGSKAARVNGMLQVECVGRRAQIMRSIVEPGEEFVLEFRARSSAVRPLAITWGVIEDMRNPAKRAEIDFNADGQWREQSVTFSSGGYLALVNIVFGDDQRGLIEFDWIRISRKEGNRTVRLHQWDFA